MEPHHAQERLTGEQVVVIDAYNGIGGLRLIAVDRLGDYRHFELGQLRCVEPAYVPADPEQRTITAEHEHDFAGTGRPVLEAGRLVGVDIPCTACPEVLRKPTVTSRQAVLG